MSTRSPVIATALILLVIGAAPAGERIEDLVASIHAASPSTTKGGRFSHFPVPFAYAPWEAEVKARFGRMSLAGANEHLYRDLPPFKAEDESVPANEVLATALANHADRATEILVAALRSDPKLPQWSVVAACRDVPDGAVVGPLVRIATKDPDATDRAFAVRVLARRRQEKTGDALRFALLDDHQSVRLLAAQGLASRGDPLGVMAILTPVSPRNPFHGLFLQKSLSLVLPEETLEAFLALPWHQRVERVKAVRPRAFEAYCRWVVRHRDRTFGAMMTGLLGDEKEAGEALATLATLTASMTRRGSGLEPRLGEAFWARTGIIETWRMSDARQTVRLTKLLADRVRSFRPETTMLLVALGYTFEKVPAPEAISHLAKVRDLKAENPDVYLAAAAGLSGQRSPEAVPSLIHVLSLGKEPFASVALGHLERLTGQETPGKPRDVGMLGKLGLPQEPLNVGKAHVFWADWYAGVRDRLKLDLATGRLVASTAPGPWALVANLARWDAASGSERRAAAEAVDEKLEAFDLARLAPFAAGGQKREVAIFRHPGTGLEFSLIPGGRTTIGSPPNEPGRHPEEVRHEVTLSPFLISRTEVTQRVWSKVETSNPGEHEGADLPVTTVSWEDARAFAEKTGLALPTEHQWETACRAGTRTAYPFGGDRKGLDAFAWTKANSDQRPHPVGKKRPNAFGLHDILGNVTEWVADGYGRYPRGPAGTDPVIPPSSRGFHVVRGGSFIDEPPGCRSAFRFGMKRDARYGMIGFRVALTVAR